MPGRDQTGPRGAGPMTGRAAGVCNTNAVDEMGGRGRGMGRGRQQGLTLQNRMADIEKRINALEGK